MFDFCVTGKPTFVLAPDLDDFRTGPRGFYFDIEAEPPGPVVRSTEELLAAMLETPLRASAQDYGSFVRRFAPHDDGSAAARAVDEIWGQA